MPISPQEENMHLIMWCNWASNKKCTSYGIFLKIARFLEDSFTVLNKE